MNSDELKKFLQICMMVGIIVSGFGLMITYIGYIIQNKDIQYFGIGSGIGSLSLSLFAGIILLIMRY